MPHRLMGKANANEIEIKTLQRSLLRSHIQVMVNIVIHAELLIYDLCAITFELLEFHCAVKIYLREVVL